MLALHLVNEFQPALPLRGVTVYRHYHDELGLFQPALPLRGVTKRARKAAPALLFQPALPLRGVTGVAFRDYWPE